jgi:flagellar biosynthesis protein FlhG
LSRPSKIYNAPEPAATDKSVNVLDVEQNLTIQKEEPFVLAVCSGKAGVGKSVLVANLGCMLSENGLKVLVWDSDEYLPNLHLLFGVEPPVRIPDIIDKEIPITKAICGISENLFILSGRSEQNSEDGDSPDSVMAIYEQLLIHTDFDLILIDTPAGASETVLKCCNIADTTALVVTDEPASLVDAYVLVKLLLPYIQSDYIKVIVNNCIDQEDADDIIEKINLATGKFLGSIFDPIATIPYDRLVRQSILQQKPFMLESENIEPESDIKEQMMSFRDNLLTISGRGVKS